MIPPNVLENALETPGKIKDEKYVKVKKKISQNLLRGLIGTKKRITTSKWLLTGESKKAQKSEI